MARALVGSSCAAVIVAIATLSAAQITPQAPTQAPLQTGSQRPNGEKPRPSGEGGASKAQLTVTGCLTRELDRRAEAANRGEGELLLLADGVAPAAPSSESERKDGALPARPGNPDGDRPRGTSGRGGVSYRLSGSLENELASHVGERVEVVGTVAIGDPEKPASDTTSSVPRLTVLSFKPASGSCR